MTDEIIKELWAVKDAIACEHAYDIDTLVDYFQRSARFRDQEFVDLSVLKATSIQGSPANKEPIAKRGCGKGLTRKPSDLGVS